MQISLKRFALIFKYVFHNLQVLFTLEDCLCLFNLSLGKILHVYRNQYDLQRCFVRPFRTRYSTACLQMYNEEIKTDIGEASFVVVIAEDRTDVFGTHSNGHCSTVRTKKYLSVLENSLFQKIKLQFRISFASFKNELSREEISADH
uniref:Uncharacterized protein n=1 Tax=Octopus bimaculoides TaxID=37653 RepID=A0A0L8GXU7_OCTBM